MMSFDDLFDKYLTSNYEPELTEQTVYDKYYQQINQNEENGTSFFHQFLPQSIHFNENPPFEVAGYKVFSLTDKPGLLQLE